MNFSRAMRSVTREGDSWRAEVGADWLQGRSAFGGLQAALGLHAMRELVPVELALRTLQLTFLRAAPAGSVAIRAACLRKGGSAMHVERACMLATRYCVGPSACSAARGH